MKDERIQKAEDFARTKHLGQKRKLSNDPYIVHPIRVAKIVSEFSDNPVLLMAALLHDTIEDTQTTYEDIKANFSDEVADMVMALTNDPEEKERMGKKEYLTKKMSLMDSDTLLVKLADRLDNVRDLNDSDLPWSRNYAVQTEYILDHLQPPVLNGFHKMLIYRIREIIKQYL
jgi:guanosine-3',5'-bis(diphosphate) 3'-pyrophosphohydrolase